MSEYEKLVKECIESNKKLIAVLKEINNHKK